MRALVWTAFLSAAVLTCAAQAQQVYRIVGPDGKVSFSDQPPAQATTSPSGSASKGNSLPQTPSAATERTGNLPAALRTPVQRYPVTLYTDKDCAPCDDARSHLVQRGIPFTEKTIESNADVQAFRRINSKNQLPTMTLGGQHVTGFEAREWNSYLTAAGYPVASQLPASYRRPTSSPLTTPVLQPAAPTLAENPDKEVGTDSASADSADDERIDPRLFDPNRPQF